MSAWIAFSLLTITATAHSVLGEILLVGPLSRDTRWRVKMPRKLAVKVLRFAWHLTTMAWIGLAAIVVGASGGVTVGIVCLASAALIFVMARDTSRGPSSLSLDSTGSMPPTHCPAPPSSS